MEDPTVPQPTILPPQETPEIHGPVIEPATTPQQPTFTSHAELLKKFAPLIAIVAILGIILVVSRVVSTKQPSVQTQVTQTPTPTVESRVVSTRTLSHFATESAFMTFDSTIEALPKIIQTAVLQDPTILPPILDLPLGFSN